MYIYKPVIDTKFPPKPCMECGNLFFKTQYKSAKNWHTRSKFCSRVCRSKSVMRGGNSASFSKERFQDKTKHPRWIDGRSASPGYHLIYSRNYKLRKRGAAGSFSFQEWEDLKKKFNYMCLCCKRIEPEIKLEADHIIPLVHGGKNSIENIQPLCRNCNAQKLTLTIDYRILASTLG